MSRAAAKACEAVLQPVPPADLIFPETPAKEDRVAGVRMPRREVDEAEVEILYLRPELVDLLNEGVDLG